MALTKEKLKELFAAGEFDQYLPDPVVTWASITGKPSTFPPSTHNHTKAQITDFPTSMPASDVYAWAKAATKPTYTSAEVGAAAASHGHSDLFPFQVGGSLDVNSTGNGTKLFVGTSASWTNRGPTGHYGSALFSMNTHEGQYYSQLWFDTAGNEFYHRTIDDGTIRAWNKVLTSVNYTSYAQKKITYGTAAPTGGVDGDIYIQY